MIQDKAPAYKVKITPGATETAKLLFPAHRVRQLLLKASSLAIDNERSEVYIVDVLQAYKFLERLA